MGVIEIPEPAFFSTGLLQAVVGANPFNLCTGTSYKTTYYVGEEFGDTD